MQTEVKEREISRGTNHRWWERVPEPRNEAEQPARRWQRGERWQPKIQKRPSKPPLDSEWEESRSEGGSLSAMGV